MQPNRYLTLSKIEMGGEYNGFSAAGWQYLVQTQPGLAVVRVVKSLCEAHVPIAILGPSMEPSDACPTVTGSPSSLVAWVKGESPSLPIPVATLEPQPPDAQVAQARTWTPGDISGKCTPSPNIRVAAVALDGSDLDLLSLRDCGDGNKFVIVWQKAQDRVCSLNFSLAYVDHGFDNHAPRFSRNYLDQRPPWIKR